MVNTEDFATLPQLTQNVLIGPIHFYTQNLYYQDGVYLALPRANDSLTTDPTFVRIRSFVDATQ